MKKRTIMGIGPVWTLLSICFAFLIILLNTRVFPELVFPFPPIFRYLFGITTLSAGFIMMIVSIITFRKAFVAKKLITKGVYSICRNPLYGSLIFFTVPGMVVLCNYALGLFVPVFMYVLFQFQIPNEEKLLEKEFGAEYLKYKKSVHALFPRFR